MCITCGCGGKGATIEDLDQSGQHIRPHQHEEHENCHVHPHGHSHNQSAFNSKESNNEESPKD